MAAGSVTGAATEGRDSAALRPVQMIERRKNWLTVLFKTIQGSSWVFVQSVFIRIQHYNRLWERSEEMLTYFIH
jgi:hypothetical protein